MTDMVKVEWCLKVQEVPVLCMFITKSNYWLGNYLFMKLEKRSRESTVIYSHFPEIVLEFPECSLNSEEFG